MMIYFLVITRIVGISTEVSFNSSNTDRHQLICPDRFSGSSYFEMFFSRVRSQRNQKEEQGDPVKRSSITFERNIIDI